MMRSVLWALAALTILACPDAALAAVNNPVSCAEMPALTGAITSSAGSCATSLASSTFTNVTATGYFATTGSTLPSQAAGTLGIGGENSAPTLGANGEADIYIGSTTGGLTLIGKGSASDLTLLNSGGTTICSVATGTTYFNCSGAGFEGVIGATGAAAGTFTTLNTTGIATLGGGQVTFGRVVTASGAVTVATTDYIVCVNKTTGAATTVNLMATPTTWTVIRVKDCKGDAATNNITVTPAAGNIDGASTFVMSVAYQENDFVYNGTQWNAF